jgi:hypothetical protein
MWLKIRAWWYCVGKEKEDMPRDVREYIIRRYMKSAKDALKTPEEKREFVTKLMEGALGLERDQISDDLRDELIKTAFELTDAGDAPPISAPKGPYPISPSPPEPKS